jgi:hypothetical protein
MSFAFGFFLQVFLQVFLRVFLRVFLAGASFRAGRAHHGSKPLSFAKVKPEGGRHMRGSLSRG